LSVQLVYLLTIFSEVEDLSLDFIKGLQPNHYKDMFSVMNPNLRHLYIHPRSNMGVNDLLALPLKSLQSNLHSLNFHFEEMKYFNQLEFRHLNVRYHFALDPVLFVQRLTAFNQLKELNFQLTDGASFPLVAFKGIPLSKSLEVLRFTFDFSSNINNNNNNGFNIVEICKIFGNLRILELFQNNLFHEHDDQDCCLNSTNMLLIPRKVNIICRHCHQQIDQDLGEYLQANYEYLCADYPALKKLQWIIPNKQNLADDGNGKLFSSILERDGMISIQKKGLRIFHCSDCVAGDQYVIEVKVGTDGEYERVKIQLSNDYKVIRHQNMLKQQEFQLLFDNKESLGKNIMVDQSLLPMDNRTYSVIGNALPNIEGTPTINTRQEVFSGMDENAILQNSDEDEELMIVIDDLNDNPSVVVGSANGDNTVTGNDTKDNYRIAKKRKRVDAAKNEKG